MSTSTKDIREHSKAVDRYLATPWVNEQLEARWGREPDVSAVSTFEDLPDGFTIGFRARDVGSSHHRGRPVRQMTLRKVGKHVLSEYQRVMGLDLKNHRINGMGEGKLYVTCWYVDDEFHAGAIVNLPQLRRLSPEQQRRLEEEGTDPRRLPFVGYSINALAAYGCVEDFYPSPEYFDGFTNRRETPGQETML